MKLVKPYTEILTDINTEEVYKTLEQVARTCYKSEDKITEDSSTKLLNRLINVGHEAMIEFFDITVLFVCDRATSQSIVRHRLASYAQESTRYCNYGKDKFDNEVAFIEPFWLENVSKEEQTIFLETVKKTEDAYLELLNKGWKPEQARVVLPSTLKTEINVKMNLREWRHFFKLRTAKNAHPQIQELAIPLLKKFHEKLPVIFEDIYRNL